MTHEVRRSGEHRFPYVQRRSLALSLSYIARAEGRGGGAEIATQARESVHMGAEEEGIGELLILPSSTHTQKNILSIHVTRLAFRLVVK